MKEILHSRILGEHPKHLLIFHGLFGESDNFGSLAKRFSEFYTVHAIDLRNHGRSFHSDDMSFDAMTEDIVNYMAHYDISEAYLLGHSLGGRVVMEFAYKYPEKTEKLIVADMAPKSYPPHHQAIIKALNAVDFDKVEKRSDAEDTLKEYISEPGVRQFLLKNIYRIEGNRYAFRFNLEVLTNSYSDLISTNLHDNVFSGPVLFIRGGESGYIQDSDFGLLEKHFPNSEVKTIPGAGHWLHAENPNMFFDFVTSFLNH